MPSVSAKQKRFMDAAAHNPAFAKKVGVPVKVAKEFSTASKGQTFSRGGEMKESKVMKKGGIATSLKAHAAAPASKAHGMKKGGMAASKMGAVKTAAPSRDGVATKGKTKGTMITMKKGGRAC